MVRIIVLPLAAAGKSQDERLAEYGWKPHRVCFGPRKAYRLPQLTGTCAKNRGVRFHRIRDFEQQTIPAVTNNNR